MKNWIKFYTKSIYLTEGTVTEPNIFLNTTSVRPIITSSVAHSTTFAASPATKAISTGGFVKHQKRNNSPRADVEALTWANNVWFESQKTLSKHRTT
jgi:hypothetical protein